MRKENEFYDDSLFLDSWGSVQWFSMLMTWRRVGLLQHEMVMEACAIRHNVDNVCRH